MTQDRATRRVLMGSSVLMMGVFVVDVVRTATLSSFIEFAPPPDLDLRQFPGAWERLGDVAGGAGFLMATLAILIAAVASPNGVRSRMFSALVGAVGLLMVVMVLAALTSGAGGIQWGQDVQAVGLLVAYGALAVAMRRGIGSTGSDVPRRRIRSRRVSTGFGILKEYE